MILGLHRRSGPELALRAWSSDAALPPLSVVGRDQGGLQTRRWREAGVAGVRFLGPRWGGEREDLLDGVAVWLAPYPDDALTRNHLCPLQVVDALGSSLPLVVPDLPSIRALTDGQKSVHHYRADDPEGLARAVRAATTSRRVHRSRPRWCDRAVRLRSLIA